MLFRSFNLSLKLTLCLVGILLFIFVMLGRQTVRLHRQHLEEARVQFPLRDLQTVRLQIAYARFPDYVSQDYRREGGSPRPLLGV